MKKLLHYVAPAIATGVFTVAAWMLYHELKQYHLSDIRHALVTMPTWRLLAALGLTAVNYLVLIGYDFLAVTAIRHPLPLRRIALASFTGFVVSYNLGALLGGTSVRYRLYSAWGLSALEIVRLLFMLGVTFWAGVFALAGVVFIFEPFRLPDSLHLPVENARPLGVLFLAISGVYMLLALLRKRPLEFRGVRFELPSPSITILQLIVAATDLVIAAGILYVLVSGDVNVGFVEFLGMYLLAAVAVVLSHVPGGVGVLEIVVLTLAAPKSSVAMIAGLLIFRVCYYLLPLSIAVTLLAGHEFLLRRKSTATTTGDEEA